MEKLLEISNATVRYRTKTLFKKLYFKVRKGQHWAIIGESGSGKTALLQTLAGEHYISEGSLQYYFCESISPDVRASSPYFTCNDLISLVEVKHDFRNLSNESAFYYQQRYNASDSDDALTVEEYLKEIAARAIIRGNWTLSLVLEKFDLYALRQKRIIQLSNGEGKRLRMAGALLKNPVVLILDTPFSGLDAATRTKFNELFQEIAATGITLILATSPYEIPDVITHVCILENNAIQTIEKSDFNPSQLKSKPFRLPDSLQIRKALNKNNRIRYNLIVGMQNVTVQYGNVQILDNVNWEIRPGERWALSGPNGSGKSTLLSLIYGDNPQAYANQIVLFDRKRGSGESIWEIKEKTGFMSPELYQYFPGGYTCLHVVESGFYDTMGLFSDANPDHEKSALQWMEILGIDQMKDIPLNNISTSRQRLCLLARALVKNPVLLILDEPCQGLDQHQQDYFKGIIDLVCKTSDLTLIYVAHKQEELPDTITHRLFLPG